MSIHSLKFNHGDEVMVFDQHGNYECRGKVVGCYACAVPLFDVQPNRSESLAKRLHAVPEGRLRRVSREVRAYEPKPRSAPRHVLDEV
jgi:hypothetical protein